MANLKNYTKPPLNHDDMVHLLQSRGLIFSDIHRVKTHLQHTGYYRLSGYFKSYQHSDDSFIVGTSFDQVRDTYIFDRKLRLHTLDAIEKIEVSLKANMNDILSLKSGPFWYLDIANFDLTRRKKTKSAADVYKRLIQGINEINQKGSRELVKYYKSKYNTSDLPSRILFQELSLGEISNIYNILPTATRQEIADVYGVYERDLQSWIGVLLNIRNICAHHGRLWNRRYPFKVRAIDKSLGNKFQKYINRSNSLEVIPNYYNLSLIFVYMLRRINKNFDRLSGLRQLLKEHKGKYNKRMGLNTKWYKTI